MGLCLLSSLTGVGLGTVMGEISFRRYPLTSLAPFYLG